jgi:DNA repair ATPase RecN
MEQEIKDIIAKNLPEQVGNVLKERLENAERDAKDLGSLRKDYGNLLTELEEKDKKIQGLSHLESRLDYIKATEESIKERKMETAIQISEIKLQEAEKRADELRSVLEIVFKSPVYRKSHSTNVHYGYENGQSQPKFASPSETIETEE